MEWKGVDEPVQVVWRRAPLSVREVRLEGGGGAVEELRSRFEASRHRLDVRVAPLMFVAISREAEGTAWVALQLLHHLAGDAFPTLEVVDEEIRAYLVGRTAELPAPMPLRNFVAQARYEVSAKEHEAFFREMLSDVDEPTAPFGLSERSRRRRQLGRRGGRVWSSRRRWRHGCALRARALGVSVASVCHLAWVPRAVAVGVVEMTSCSARCFSAGCAGGGGRGSRAGDVHQHVAGPYSCQRRQRARRCFDRRTRASRVCCGTSTRRSRSRSAAPG